jgi:hypothetical protein
MIFRDMAWIEGMRIKAWSVTILQAGRKQNKSYIRVAHNMIALTPFITVIYDTNSA